MDGLRIEQVPITHPDALALIEAVQAEYVVRYGGRDESPIDPHEFEPGAGAFFVGYAGGVPVASGSWRRRPDLDTVEGLSPGPVAEIKRMYVVPTHQRRGLARQMVAHLEQTAAATGIETMVLETGSAQPEAIALYESCGYARIADFGHYRGAPEVRSFARRLDHRAGQTDSMTDVTPGQGQDQQAREQQVTAEVLASFAGSTTERYREVMGALVTHLHAFAREVRLTEAEWQHGVDFLTRCGEITDDRRQEFILLSDVLGLSMLTVAVNQPDDPSATESTVFGPFFVEGAP